MNLKDLYTSAYIGAGNLVRKEAAAGNTITRGLFQAVKNLQKADTPQARRALADALVHNKRVVDRFYNMHTNFNNASYNSFLNSIDPHTLKPRYNRTYPLATPNVKRPMALNSFLGKDVYKTVAAQHNNAGRQFIADNAHLWERPGFTPNIDAYSTPYWTNLSKSSKGEIPSSYKRALLRSDIANYLKRLVKPQ